MPALIGREREVATALGVFATVRTTPVARSLAIEGPSGVGKTALLSRLRDETPDWIHVTAAAHRIQASLPMAVVRRLIADLRRVLGENGAKYTAGLDGNADDGATLLRIIEGVTLDHPVFISVDDAQWCDEESAETLDSTLAALADRPIALVTTERTDPNEPLSTVQSDVRITLGPLGNRDASEAARSEYPEGNDEVVAAIVAHSGGHPIDLISLAQSARERGATTGDEVADSLRAVTVKHVQTLPVRIREFLQIISLLNEPIDYALLRRMWTDDRVLVDLITEASERFLIQEGTNLRFSHAMLSDAVHETIPVKIPMRRRIIEALRSVPSPTLEDRLQIAEQAFAIGDRELAMDTLLHLALEATERGQVHLTINVAEQLRDAGEPRDEHFVPFYVGYGRALMFIDRLDRGVEVLQHGFEEATRRRLTGTSTLAAQLVLAQWFSDQHERALTNYEQFSSQFSAPQDRMALHAAAMWFALCNADFERYQQIDAELSELTIPLPAELRLRRQIVRAFMMLRSGSFAESREAIARVEEIARTVPDALRNNAHFARMFVEVSLMGVHDAPVAEMRAKFSDDENGPWMDYHYGFSELLAGRYHNAVLVIEDALRRYNDPVHRRRMLGIAAALSAMEEQPSQFDRAIETDITRLLTGERGIWFMPLASWATMLPTVSDSRARILGRTVLAHLSKPNDPFIITLATPVAASARMRGDTELLQQISSAESMWDDRSPLVLADRQLARAIARESIDAKAQGMREAIDACVSMGLTALETLAARLSKKTSAPKAETASPLTARERQIANLVAEGKSNREIAESLVLSERTVEGHIANIFNKLNVSSRTQVAAWFLRATTA
jgi:DNA-binding CsgD family transcriptional regulator